MTNFFQNLPIPKELRDALNSETSTEDGSGGVSAAPRTAKFIVGNALNGDTLDVCDFLDPGNCTGIAAALAAATALGAGCDIYLRPGTYDTTAAGAPTLPMELPPGTGAALGPSIAIRTVPPARLLAGVGFAEPMGARIIVGDQRHIFVPTGDVGVVYFEGLFFDVLPSTSSVGEVMVGGPAGPGPALVGTFNSCQVRLPTAPELTETLRFLFNTAFGGQFYSCDVFGQYQNGEAGGTFLAVMPSATVVSDCALIGVDYCVSGESGASEECTVVNCNLRGWSCIYSEVRLVARGNLFDWSGPVGVEAQEAGSSIVGNNFNGTVGGTAALLGNDRCTFANNTIRGSYANGVHVSLASCCVSGNSFVCSNVAVCISVAGDANNISGNAIYGENVVGIDVEATASRTVIAANSIVGSTVADIRNSGTDTLLGPLLRGLQPPTSAAACPVGVVDEMRGNAAGFTVCTAVRPVAVPTSTENVWGNYNAAQLDGGWWVGVDATRWKFGCGRASDSSVVENFSGGELTDYPPGAFLNKLFLLTIRVSGTTGELFVNDRLVSTITLTGGYQPATLGLAPMIHTNNNGAVPRLVIGVPFVAGGYVEAVLTNAEIRDNYYAMQRGGSLAPTASGAQWTSIYNVYNDPTTNGITDSLAARGAFTAVDPVGVDELRIMW